MVLIQAQISCARFTKLAALIVEAFPGELAATYYIPSSTRGRGKSAAGKLYDQYANLNKILRKVKLRAIRPGQRDTVFELSGRNGDIPSLPPKPTADDHSIERDLRYVETYVEPWSEIKEKWEKTCSYRMNYLRSEQQEDADTKCAAYISKYPALSQPAGHLLLEHDFEILFNNAANRMQTTWLEFSKNLRSELRRQNIKCGASDVDLLFAFAKLFPVIPVKIKNHKPWRASRAEIQEGFLVHIKVIGDLEKQLDGMTNTALQRGCTIQPFPLVVGPTLSTIHSSYLIIETNSFGIASACLGSGLQDIPRPLLQLTHTE